MTTPEIVRSIPTSDNYLLSPVMDVALAKQRLKEFQEFVRDYLVKGEDFGEIPGAPKPTLLKPGADKLCELYGLSDDYEFIERVEDYERGIFDYTIKCILTDRRRGVMVSSGLGSCNSWEKKYRWRDAKRVCPQCGKDAIIKGKEEYGGGWLCFGKKGGCNAKFAETDPKIVEQTVGRVANEDVADLKNTILKMSKKRAKVDATLSATRSSGIFTQDIEDMPRGEEPPQPSTPAKGEVIPPSSPEAQSAAPAFNAESERVTWLDTFAPLSPEDFVRDVIPGMKDDMRRRFIQCADDNLLSVVFNRLPDAAAFSAFFVPMNKVAVEIGKKEFIIKKVRPEADRRNYTVDRANGTYVEKKEGATK